MNQQARGLGRGLSALLGDVPVAAPAGSAEGVREIEIGSIQPGKAADLAVWRIAEAAELGYWLGLMPERRIFGGQEQ